MTGRRLSSLPDDRLGEAVASLRDDLRWREPAADPAARVLHQIRSGRRPPRQPWLPSRRRTILLIAAALLGLAAVAAAATLIIRLGAVTIVNLPGTPTALPSSPVRPPDLGERITLGEAVVGAGIDPAFPAALGEPDAVWLDQVDAGPDGLATRMVMAWRPRPDLPAIPGTRWGAVFYRFAGDSDVAVKLVYGDLTRLEAVEVGDTLGYRVRGPHELTLLTDEGFGSFRVTGNVLVWDDAGGTSRLEIALGLRRMLAIAETA